MSSRKSERKCLRLTLMGSVLLYSSCKSPLTGISPSGLLSRSFIPCRSVALVIWGFGFVWLLIAIGSILHIRIRGEHIPFNMGWWGFTFPIGVFTSATVQFGTELDSVAFKVLGTIFTVSLVLLWITVAVGTAIKTWQGVMCVLLTRSQLSGRLTPGFVLFGVDSWHRVSMTVDLCHLWEVRTLSVSRGQLRASSMPVLWVASCWHDRVRHDLSSTDKSAVASMRISRQRPIILQHSSLYKRFVIIAFMTCCGSRPYLVALKSAFGEASEFVSRVTQSSRYQRITLARILRCKASHARFAANIVADPF